MIDLWNLLHDGAIERVEEFKDETYRFVVSIEYLTEVMGLGSDLLHINLLGCSQFASERFLYGDEPGLELRPLAQLKGSSILSADSPELPIIVWLDDGKLTLVYDRVEISTADGRPLSIEEIAAAAKKYWDDFGRT